ALAGDRAPDEVARTLALDLELELAAVGDHGALPGQHLTLNDIFHAFGVLQAHPRGGGCLRHGFGFEKFTAHGGETIGKSPYPQPRSCRSLSSMPKWWAISCTTVMATS